MLSSNGPEVNKEQMEEQCNIFLVMFLKLYPTKHVTPYMHGLRWHVLGFIEMYGKICPFTQQGLEKLNDKTTKDFFGSTNQQGVGMSVRMAREVISIQNGSGMLTSSIRRAHGVGRETDFNSQSDFKTWSRDNLLF